MQMKFRIKHQKPIAAFMLLLMGAQTLLPVTALALTSGPTQPEASSFKQAGVSDMVDPFTGNFSYNLPLMDVDGYPLNLNYSSGSGIDDEASWVGLGWSLNVGAVNRQLRGIADDLSGDEFTTEQYTKPKVTVGGRLTAKVEVKGKGALKNLGASGSFSLGVFSDNYTGIGAELGANAGISYSFAGSGAMTAGMGLGLMSNTQSGVDVTPSLSLSYKMTVAENTTVSPGLSASIGYNTRGGLKGLTLGASFSMSGQKVDNETGKVKNGGSSYDLGGSTISYNTDPISPKIQVPYRSSYGSFSFDIGGAAWLIFAGGGGTGYKSVREVKNRVMKNPGYGFLYAERARKLNNAMMDFIREKESVVMPELPNIAIPVATPDVFSYTSQAGSGQFRLYRGGSGVFFDNEAKDESSTQTLGFDAGIGGYAHGGITYYEQSVKNVTKKWATNNQYQPKADFQEVSPDNPNAENVFFKQVGEKNQEDKTMVDKLKGTQAVAVDISGKTANSSFRLAGNSIQGITSTLAKIDKQKRRTAISYLTALEASNAGLDKRIKWYGFIDANTPFNPTGCSPVALDSAIRYDTGDEGIAYRKKHHISEVTVTDEGGKRSVYGIPVYNAKQSEYSFAIGSPGSGYGTRDDVNNNIKLNQGGISFSQSTSGDNDNYYHRDDQPGYATSYLLTAILSPDYQDATGNGITDDDNGTGMKFNYSKVSGLYNWRSPVNKDVATMSKGLLADPDDDKGSFVYGKKELWFLQSIETKTQIAYFITEDRQDGFGVADLSGGIDVNKKQKVLKEIRLYSKADLTKPIKIVKLEYAYSLLKNVPNSTASGKLTLKKVYFQYGMSDKGKAHPYLFTYNGETGDGYMSQDVEYGNLQTDRWGTYKSRQSNTDRGVSLRNDEFPYSAQTASEANKAAGLWQLSNIQMPTGGEINVTYESDDYAFVQNKQAMTMVKFNSLLTAGGGNTTSLIDARGMELTMPYEPKLSGESDPQWFKRCYLNGSEYLYTKLFVNVGGLDARSQVNNENYYDFIPCYAKVTGASITGTSGSNVTVKLQFETISSGGVTMSPMLQAAWQRLRMEYPRYAYPGYRNRVTDGDAGKAVKAAVSAIVNAAKNLDELRRSFYQRAKAQSFCNNYSASKSFVRITDVTGKKLGGGSRVKKIAISDKWNDMTNGSAAGATYGQEYEYTTLSADGKRTISSGVASFEPSVGNDENPLRQPVPYVQNIKGGLNNFYNLEEPFGESFFPGASVGYSKVTVRDLTATGDKDPDQKTGYVVNEFYTAKEFPVITEVLSNKVNQHGPSGWYSMFGSSSVHELTFSQGYAITLNDMHGKPKATRVFNKTNEEISTTEYFYNTEPLNAGEFKLKNIVDLVNEKGEIEEGKIIGREIELFADMREQETNSAGETIGIGLDVFPLPFFGVPGFLPHWPYKENNEYKLFRSAATMKVIQYYGILDKVVKTVDGSSVATENVAYDGLTGETVITKTYNEFDKPVYTVNFPAYWVYTAMGGAYKNVGTLLPGLSTNSDGVVTKFNAFLSAGDELVDVNNGNIYWVIESGVNGNTTNTAKRIVNRNGNRVTGLSATVKVLRSGYRNMLTPPATSIVCLNNPIKTVGGTKYVSFSKFEDQTDMKVLSASATVFDDDWGVKVPCPTCPPGYTLTPDGQNCKLPLIENTNYCFTLCAGSNDPWNYGTSGAYIRNPEGVDVNVRSTFWGGVGSGFRMATASAATVDSSKLTPASILSATAATPLAAAAIATDVCERSNTQPNVGWGGRLVNTGLWLCSSGAEPWIPNNGEWAAFETCIDVPETRQYYIGFAADNEVMIYFDDESTPSFQVVGSSTSNHNDWYVRPINLDAGHRKIRVEFTNAAGHASVGVEIYYADYETLSSTSYSAPSEQILFSTGRDVLGHNVQVYRDAHGANIPRYTCANGQALDVCGATLECGTIPVNTVVNPYVKGFRGNWRPYKTEAFQVNRKYNNLFNTEPLGLNIKNAGYFESFSSFFSNNGAKWNRSSNPQWVTANTITLYDKYGQELENKDALCRYSAATFVFRGDQPGAVAANAKNREIYSESFEDYNFRPDCFNGSPGDYCDPLFKIDGSANLAAKTTKVKAHSGRYALKLETGGMTLSTSIHTTKVKGSNDGNECKKIDESSEFKYLTSNSQGEFSTKFGTGIYPGGFAPSPEKKYIYSAWVRTENDKDPDNTPEINLIVNGVTVPLTVKAIVERWKQVEGTIDLPANTNNTSLTIQVKPAGGNVYIDDLRIHPFDAHMKSYAYDDRNLRLMAEMDENNFATFYEYDDEGNLVRVKKETERGIMTIKENRSSYRKRQTP